MKAYTKFSTVALVLGAASPSIAYSAGFDCGEIKPNVYVRATEVNQQCSQETDYNFHPLPWGWPKKHNCHLANAMKQVEARCSKSETSMAISFEAREWGNYAQGGIALADWAPFWRATIQLPQPKKLRISAAAETPTLACRLNTSGSAIEWIGRKQEEVYVTTDKLSYYIIDMSCTSKGAHLISPAISEQWTNYETIGFNFSIAGD